MDASFAQVAQHGLPERARTMMPEGFDWSGANAVLAQTRQHLEQNAAERPITLRYFHCDHLGTPFAVSDTSGKVIWSATFDPWGRLLDEFNPEGIDQPIRFQGQFFDPESGLHYNRHRYYDPSIGSYIHQDPIGLAGGANKYHYCTGQPTKFIDPLGLQSEIGVATCPAGGVFNPVCDISVLTTAAKWLLVGGVRFHSKARRLRRSYQSIRRPSLRCT